MSQALAELKAYEDIAWLVRRHPQATEADKDRFVEKVGIAVSCGWMDEETAREAVWVALFVS